MSEASKPAIYRDTEPHLRWVIEVVSKADRSTVTHTYSVDKLEHLDECKAWLTDFYVLYQLTIRYNFAAEEKG